MNDYFKGKRVLVTGGTGSIGSEIVRQLLNLDVDAVVIFSRDEIKQFIMKTSIEDRRLQMVMGDIRDLESVRNVFEKHSFDIVYHAAAMKHLVVCENEPLEAVKTNILGTNNLIRMAEHHNVPQVITISTDKAASPTCVMGATKFIAEQITINAAVDTGNRYSCVRFGNVANSRGSIIPLIIERILNNQYIWISDPQVTRFIMRIADAVKLVLLASIHAHGGEKFILKMKSFILEDLAAVIKDRIYQKISKSKEPLTITQTGLASGEKIDEELLNTIEFSRVYENDTMYLIPHVQMSSNDILEIYPDFQQSEINNYNSRDAARLTQSELEEIIVEYLQTLFI